MTPEDAELARNIRRIFGRRPIDTSRLEVVVNHGRVVIGGTVCRLRDQPLITVQDEVNMVEKTFLRDQMVKTWAMEARVIQGEDEEKEEGPARGRMRHGA